MQNPGEVVIWDRSMGPRFETIDLESAVQAFRKRASGGYLPPVVVGFSRYGRDTETVGHVTAMRHDGTRLYATMDVEWSACIGMATSEVHEVAVVKAGTQPREKE